VAIGYFDFGPRLAFNDDFTYAWSTSHLASGHLYPRQSALALPQSIIGWMVAAPFGYDQRVLRASQLILILAGAWAAYRLARRLGAGRSWSLLSPIVLLTSPIFFNLATSYMSDAAYTALVLMACNASVSWIGGASRGRVTFGVGAILATLQRLVGIGLVLAMALALIIRWRRSRGPFPTSDAAWLAIAAAGSGIAAVAPGVLGISAGSDVINRLSQFNLGAAIGPLAHMPVVAGYLLLPLAGAVRVRWNLRLALVALPSAVLIVLLMWQFQWLPGNIWTFAGPAPTLAGFKPPPFPLAGALIIVAVCPIVFWLLGPVASFEWSVAASDSRFVLLMLISGVQLLLLVPNTFAVYDRYYLPVVAPLIPMLCALAAGRGRPGAAVFATLVCAALLLLGIVYEQDYQSWQVARDQAARLAYRCAAPAQVNAGYEANAVYVEVPTYESTGRSMPTISVGRDITVLGPEHPRLWLEFAAPDDSRIGVGYASAAGGKVVIQGSVCSAILQGGVSLAAP
jgi:hypothetical protein